jgi:hypothetical protein
MWRSRWVPLLLISVALCAAARAAARQDQDAEKIAKALASKLSGPLGIEGGVVAGAPGLADLRRYDDGITFWLILYVRPNQNRDYPGYYGNGFVTGRLKDHFAAVRDIALPRTFGMQPASPWSLRAAGIGRVEFYREASFKRKWLEQTSDTDVPFLVSWPQRERIGSIVFCPGVAFYADPDFSGESRVLSVCQPQAKATECIRRIFSSPGPARSVMSQAGSMHADGLVKQVVLYHQPNCQGPSQALSTGPHARLDFTRSGPIESVGLVFHDVRPFGAPTVAK